MSEVPEKWQIKVTHENINSIKKFYNNHISEYEGCKNNWTLRIGIYFTYPQQCSGAHSSHYIYANYTRISYDIFKKYILNEELNYEIC